MSVSVKVNGITYSDVNSVRLPLADGNGFAKFLYSGTEGTDGEDATYLYSLAAGNLAVLKAGVTIIGSNITIQTTNTGRASVYCLEGEFACVEDKAIDGVYYPIPVPADATAVTITNNIGANVGAAFYTYENYAYTRVNDVGWKPSGTTIEFEAGAYHYLTVNTSTSETITEYTVEFTK